MFNCGPLVGVPVNYLLLSINETADTLKSYETLIAMAPDSMERNMLIQMYREDVNILSSLTTLYTSLTGYSPFLAPLVQKLFTSYIDGLETVLLANLEVAQLFSRLYLSAEIKNIYDSFIKAFALKCVQAANLNDILLKNKHK